MMPRDLSNRTASWILAYGLAASSLLILLLSHQSRVFTGEDWLRSIQQVLLRGGEFAGDFSLHAALAPRNLFESSYGPLFYLYELARVLPFQLVGVPFHEVSFRYVGSLYAFLGVVVAALIFRRCGTHARVSVFLLLVPFSPSYLEYFRSYGAAFILSHAVQLGVVTSLILYLRHGRSSALTLFYLCLFLDLAASVTSVNTLLACSALLIVWRRWPALLAEDGLVAARERGLRGLFLGNAWQMALAALCFAAVCGIVAFNYTNFDRLAANTYHYQGAYAHGFAKVGSGTPSPWLNALTMTHEAVRGINRLLLPLLALAIAVLWRARCLSPLALVFLVVFILACLQCLFMVPNQELLYNFRFKYYTFPLLVVVSDVVGRLLDRSRIAMLWLGVGFGITLLSLGLRPVADVVSIVNAEPPAWEYKALGYTLRRSNLDGVVRDCTGGDLHADGPRTFYMNHVPIVNVFTTAAMDSKLCVLILDDPSLRTSRRIQKVLTRSRLRHRISVSDGGEALVEVYLNDAVWRQWTWPQRIDMSYYSRRFSEEYRSLDRLLDGTHWATW